MNNTIPQLFYRQWQLHTYSIRCPWGHCNQWQTWPHFPTALQAPWSCWAAPIHPLSWAPKKTAVKDVVLEWCVIYDPGVWASEIFKSSNFQSFWTLRWSSHWCFGNFTAYPCEWLASVFRATLRCAFFAAKQIHQSWPWYHGNIDGIW